MLDWRVRTVFNTLITALLLTQVLLIGARINGNTGVHWGVVFVPFWIIDVLLVIYTLAWFACRDQHLGAAVRVDDPYLAHVADHGVPGAVYAADLSALDRTVDRRAAVNTGLSAALHMLVTVTLAPLLIAFQVLLVVHVEDAAAVSIMAVLAPLIAWLALLLIAVLMRPLWAHGYAPFSDADAFHHTDAHRRPPSVTPAHDFRTAVRVF